MTTSTPRPPGHPLDLAVNPLCLMMITSLSAATIVLSPTQLGLEVLKGLVVTPTDQLAWPCRLSTPSQGGHTGRQRSSDLRKNTAAKKINPNPPPSSTRTSFHNNPPKACRSYTENFQKVGDTPSLYRDPGPKRTLSCAL